MPQGEVAAPSTVLSCGKLRISVPAEARTPSLRVLPSSGAVEISFADFSGAVLFEVVDDTTPLPSRPTSRLQPVTEQTSPVAQSSPPSSESIPLSHSSAPPPASQARPTLPQPVASQALQLPSSESLQPLPSSESLQLSQPSSELNPLPASQPLPLSQQLSQPLLTPPFPATQMPDESLGSQPSQPSLNVDQFAHHHYVPLTPPSDDDEEPQGPPDEDLEQQVSQSPPAKRQAPRPDQLPVKQGKRVRFQKDPEYFSQSPVASQTPEDDEEGGVEAAAIESKPLKPSPWKRLEISGEQPARRWGATFTRINENCMILLGGESEAEGFFQDMSILDVSKSAWIHSLKDTPNMPCTGRAWHTTTSVDQCLFVFGGEKEVDGERTQTNDSLMYDTTYFTWYPPALRGTAPSPRAGHCAALLPGAKSVVVYGGIHGNRWLNDLHLLEEMSSWSKVRLSNKSAKPVARSYATLTEASGFLVLFGGNNKTRCFNDVHLLNGKDMIWKQPLILGRQPRPRTGHCAMTSKDGKSVVVYGGWDDQGVHRHFYSDVWELRIKSPTECQWVCLFSGDNATKIPGPRAGAALERAGGKMLLFGGWHQISYFNDITELTLPFAVRPCAAVRTGN